MHEMQEDDYKLTPSGPLLSRTSVSQYGKHKGEFPTTDEALEWVKADMERSQFWPSIWWISDHGNGWMIDTDGKEIPDTPEEEHQHEWGPVESARFTGNPHRKCLTCGEITLDLDDDDGTDYGGDDWQEVDEYD